MLKSKGLRQILRDIANGHYSMDPFFQICFHFGQRGLTCKAYDNFKCH